MKIEEIEVIGPDFGETFRDACIMSTEKVLEATQTPGKRAHLAEPTGISKEMILKFSNMADLFRIHRLGQEYAELLNAAGVDTVPELALRNAENLIQKME